MEIENVQIRGEINEEGQRLVYVNGVLLTPLQSRNIWDLSPTFEWGLGARPALQLSFALCLEILKDVPKAEQMSISFKNTYVTSWRLGQPFDVSLNFGEFVRTWSLKKKYLYL